MNGIDQKWWDIIKQPGGQVPGGMPSPASPQSPLMGMMQGGGLARWLNQPRQPGSGGTPQPAPVPQATAPTPQAPQQGGGTNALGIMQQGYGYHPEEGFMSLSPQQRQMYEGQMKASTPRAPVSNPELFLQWLRQQGGAQPYGDQAQGVSGVAGNGPDGTDGGIY